MANPLFFHSAQAAFRSRWTIGSPLSSFALGSRPARCESPHACERRRDFTVAARGQGRITPVGTGTSRGEPPSGHVGRAKPNVRAASSLTTNGLMSSVVVGKRARRYISRFSWRGSYGISAFKFFRRARIVPRSGRGCCFSIDLLPR